MKKYNVDCFAIGNGTASHETEEFAADVIRELDCGVSYMVVSEAGASVYSASKLAAKEFPDMMYLCVLRFLLQEDCKTH